MLAVISTATVKLRSADGQVHVQASVGTGPVDACFKAVDEITKTQATLVEYRVHAVTEDGAVLVASGSGSQIPSYVYGGSKVIWWPMVAKGT